MKTIKGFKLRTVAGESIISGESIEQINFNKLISLNSTAAFLWKSIEGKEFNTDTLVNLLIDQYDIDINTATTDATDIINEWKNAELIEG